jgi:hypothetical protein
MLAVTSNAIGITVTHTFNSSEPIVGEIEDDGPTKGNPDKGFELCVDI